MIEELPFEILNEFFRLLDIQTLFNVSLTCKTLNTASFSLVYEKLNLTWEEIEEVTSQIRTDDSRLNFMKSLRIESDGHGEWTISPQLPVLSAYTGDRWEELHVVCALRSSGWLKYLCKPLESIKTMTLTNNGLYDNYTFDFSHLTRTLPNLESLTLGDSSGGFTIDSCSEGGLMNLRYLRVENCEWEYPTRLSDVSTFCELETLQIAYSKYMHPFQLSERLKSEFARLPRSLRNLEVEFKAGTKISWHPLDRCCPLAKLTTVTLYGITPRFEFGLRSLAKFPSLKKLIEH